MKHLILCCAALTWMVACAPQPEVTPPPSDLIDRDRFAQIMIDVQLIEGMRVHKLGPKRENKVDMAPLYAEVFDKFDVTEEEFRRTFDYYKEHPGVLKDIYEEVIDSLTTMEVRVKREFQDSEMARRDSINRAKGLEVDKAFRSPPPE